MSIKSQIHLLKPLFEALWDRFLYTRKQNPPPKKIYPSNHPTENPLISIIMPIYNGPKKWLKEAIESVINQTASNWELCIVDDKSTHSSILKFLKDISNPQIRVIFLPENCGISGALNAGIALSKGSYITFMDQDDLLELDAIETLNEGIKKYNPDVLYTDEDLMKEGFIDHLFHSPHFKPDFSPDLLLSHNYVTHLMVIKRDIMDSCGLFRSELDGAQDYDYILRVSEKADTICHIRKILYHWRIHKNSTSNACKSVKRCTLAGKKSLNYTLKRKKIIGDVQDHVNLNFFRIRQKLIKFPLVSIIIPFNGHIEFLNRCFDSILSKTTYSPYEILLAINCRDLPLGTEVIEKWKEKYSNLRVIEFVCPLNDSAIYNYAIQFTKGEYLVLMHNSVEILSPDWIQSLLEHSVRDETGVVGGKLYYSDMTIQHAGIVVGINGIIGTPHKFFPGHSCGYFNNLLIARNVSAITSALLMVKKSKFLEVGSFDDRNLPSSFYDVDFCIRLLEKGYLNVFTPYCEAIQAESKTRWYENTYEKKTRLNNEAEYLRTRHNAFFESGDPWYNPNFSLENENLRFCKSVPKEKIFGLFRRGKNGRMYYDPIMPKDA